MRWRRSYKWKMEEERGGEETKLTQKPQEAALTNGAVLQPTSAVL